MFNSVHNTAYKSKATLLQGIDAVESKLVARNTVRYKLADGTIKIRYQETDVVTFKPNGNVKLDSGGWKTKTTKSRMHDFMPRCWQVWSIKGIWYIQTPVGSVLFYDGMEFKPDGTPVGKTAKNESKLRAQQKKDEKLIKRYVEKIAKEPWPSSAGGDPWVFANPTTGKYDDPAVVRSWLKDEYVFATMIMNAIKWAGHTEHYAAMAYRTAEGSSLRKDVGRTVRRYLRACLGYAV